MYSSGDKVSKSIFNSNVNGFYHVMWVFSKFRSHLTKMVNNGRNI